jgi:branched-subunit amino acid aminotransferase/4-amino-4-deoxychorismate lyase
MSLFESFPVRQGRGAFLSEHLARLRQAAQQRHFTLPPAALESVAVQLQQADAEGFARIYLTAGAGDVAAEGSAPELLLLVEERPRPDSAQHVRVALSPEPYHAPFGGLKTGNYWANVEAFQRARHRAYDETLLFNANGELVSASMANVFLVEKGMLRTPAPACGARQGVVRQWVLGQGPVRECSLFIRDVENAEEIFITNSWRGIVSISAVEKRTLQSVSIASEFRAAFAVAETAG